MADRAVLRDLHLRGNIVRRHARGGRNPGAHPVHALRGVRAPFGVALGLRGPQPHHPPHHAQLPHDLDRRLLPVHLLLPEGRLDEKVPGKADHEEGGMSIRIIYLYLIILSAFFILKI